MDKRALEKLASYRLWLENAVAENKALASFKCPSCQGEIKTLCSPQGEAWDTFSNCPYCRCLLFKVTRGEVVSAEQVLMIGTAPGQISTEGATK